MKCQACDLLFELQKLLPSNYSYWLLTELFVELHNGNDYCVHKKVMEE